MQNDINTNTQRLFEELRKDRPDTALCRQLIAQGVDTKAEGYNGRTLIRQALWAGKKEIIEDLRTAERNAIAKLPPSERPGGIDEQDTLGETALHRAVRDNDEYRLRALIQGGANLDIRNTDGGETALTLAISADKTELALLLIEAGADVNIQTDNGYTPLMISVYKGDTSLVSILAKKTQDISTTNANNYTAQMCAEEMCGQSGTNPLVTDTIRALIVQRIFTDACKRGTIKKRKIHRKQPQGQKPGSNG
ncbi:MAG: ankyrin repeat domain-containing protein [Alphaproteobacteria bacterium]|nr:ankyrin repeat domain-containing protein [Alphaproteobacteria bacterium]